MSTLVFINDKQRRCSLVRTLVKDIIKWQRFHSCAGFKKALFNCVGPVISSRYSLVYNNNTYLKIKALMITAAYASFLTLLYVYLSIRIISIRRGKKISLGTGADKQLERAIRVHSNFSEYVPLSLLLILMLELQSVNYIIVIFLGLLLLVGRCIHAYGVSQQQEDFRLRVYGMILTFMTLIFSSVINLGYFALHLLVKS